MKKIICCFVFCVLMFCLAATSYASLSRFAGYWKNVDPNTGGVTKIKILVMGTKITVQAWGKCHPRDCDWGKVNGYAYGPNVSANLSADTRAITALFDSGFSQTLMIIEPYGKDRLEVNVYDHFTDNSKRTDYCSTPIFIRSQKELIGIGYELFWDGVRVGHEARWSFQRGAANLLWNRKRHTQKNVEGWYFGKKIVISGIGYELFWDGVRVGHEPNWSMQKAESNLQWNRKKYPKKNVVGFYSGRELKGCNSYQGYGRYTIQECDKAKIGNATYKLSRKGNEWLINGRTLYRGICREKRPWLYVHHIEADKVDITFDIGSKGLYPLYTGASASILNVFKHPWEMTRSTNAAFPGNYWLVSHRWSDNGIFFDLQEQIGDETRWQLVQGDIFVPGDGTDITVPEIGTKVKVLSFDAASKKALVKFTSL